MNEKKAQVPTDSTAAPVDEKKAKKAAYEAKYKAAHDEAKVRIKAFLKDNAEQLGGLKADIEMFLGKGQHGPIAATKRGVNSDLRDTFLAKKALTEMDIFKQFKIGRPEMTNKIRVLVLCPNPADRVWVKFDEPTETYNVVGTGETPPKGWDGYVPSTKVSAL